MGSKTNEEDRARMCWGSEQKPDPILRSELLHDEVRDSCCKHQKAGDPTDEFPLRVDEDLVHLFLEGRLGGDIDLDLCLSLFEADMSFPTHNPDRFDQIAASKGLRRRSGKI